MTNKTYKNKNTLPNNARLSINHCNLPASIIGGLIYNEYPVPLLIDGVNELHKNLFNFLKKISHFEERQELFNSYMRAHFQLDDRGQLREISNPRFNREKANYQRIILGWHMNQNGSEGAVLKRWVESRFGLTPRFHISPIRSFYDSNYENYLLASAAGIYNAMAIESQLDLLYSYSQYELNLLEEKHITLYRGINHLDQHEIIEKHNKNIIFLLNNINSFTTSPDLAEHFGDYVLKIVIPVYKVFCFNKILPGKINAENEYIVIGGLYRAKLLK